MAPMVGKKKKKKPACLFRRHKRWNFRALDQENPLEKEMATHSSLFVWEIPWTEKPGRLQSMGSQSRTVCTHGTSSKREIKGR